MIKFKFGVMSNKWSLEAPDSTIAKIAMSVFIGQNIPIAIYSPNTDAFMPKDILVEPVKLSHEDSVMVRAAVKSIKKVKPG
jgi:hypothetical protein